MKPCDILVAGEINPDLILGVDAEPEFGQVEKLVSSADLTVGSSSVIFACGAARLGFKVAFVGVCGDDIFGHFMLEEMSKRKVDVSSVHISPELQTGLSIILSRGNNRAILTHAGAIADLRAEAVTDDLLQKSRHLHVSSYFLQKNLQPGLPNLFQRARSLGKTTSLDTNWDPSGGWNGLNELFPCTDVFLPNENEALAISQARTTGQALKRLGRQTGTVAIKRGAEGSLACRGGETASACALSGSIVDTVGAGDTFDAGFIFGFLKGWSLEKTLWFATICGSLSTRAAGGTASQPTLDEAMKFM